MTDEVLTFIEGRTGRSGDDRPGSHGDACCHRWGQCAGGVNRDTDWQRVGRGNGNAGDDCTQSV